MCGWVGVVCVCSVGGWVVCCTCCVSFYVHMYVDVHYMRVKVRICVSLCQIVPSETSCCVVAECTSLFVKTSEPVFRSIGWCVIKFVMSLPTLLGVCRT